MATNISAPTAMVIDWGVTTQDVTSAASPDWEVWYAYTAKSGEHAIQLKVESSGDYVPGFMVYDGTAGAPTAIDYFALSPYLLGTRAWGTIPGQTYWIKVEQTDSGVTPDNDLTLTIVRPPNEPVPAGSILARSFLDGQGDFTVALDASTGEVLRVFNMDGGPSCSMLPSGISLGTKTATDNLRLYGADLQPITDIAVPWNYGLGSPGITNNGVDTFYVLVDVYTAPSTTVGYLYKISDAGVILDSWTGFNTTDIKGYTGAVAPDESLLYWITGSLTYVARYDLVTSTLGSGLTTPSLQQVAGGSNTLVLPSGNILQAFYYGDSYVLQINASTGATVIQYDMPQDHASGASASWLAPALDWPLSFWVVMNDSTAAPPGVGAVYDQARYQNIRVSDGVVLADVMVEAKGGDVGYAPTYSSFMIMPVALAGTIEDVMIVGTKTTVRASRVVAFGLDDDTHVDDDPGTFYVHGATVLDGDVSISGTLTGGGGGSGDVVGPGSATDNAITRYDGTTGKLVQNSGITIADAASGTLAGSNSGDVSLAGSPNYLTLAAQVITRALIDLTTHVTGRLPFANLVAATTGPVIIGKETGSGSFAEITVGSGLSITSGVMTASGGGSGAPTTASYVTLGTDATLTNERVLTAGTGISLTDGGAGSTITIASAASGDSTHTAVVASIPSASNAGDLFFPSDGFVVSRDTGAAWVPWGPLFPFTDPALASLSTWINQGSATVTTTNGGIFLLGVSGTGENFRIRKKTAPSTPYTITACFLPQLMAIANQACGLVFRQSSDGKMATCTIGTTSGGTGVAVYKYTSATAFSASYVSLQRFEHGGPIFLRITDNGTNRISSISRDGVNFMQIHTVGRTDFLTADEVGFYVNSDNATYAAGTLLLSWKET